MSICRQRIEKHGLEMKLVDVEYNFEGSKILFFFTSEGRVDFRELVKDLAGIFKTRIELRQIGVRDEARMLGGLGICGRPFCCAQFLDDFQPVSIKMAKTQGLSLNPVKISGSCGRLMCCLKYEQDAYEELVQSVPKIDAFVETPAGVGTVVDVNLLKGTVRVRLEDPNDMSMKTFEAAEVTVLGGKAKRAEYLAALAEGRIEPPQKSQPRLRRTAAPAAPARTTPERPARESERPQRENRNSSRAPRDAAREDTRDAEARGQHPAGETGNGPESENSEARGQRRGNNQRRNHSRQDSARRQGQDNRRPPQAPQSQSQPRDGQSDQTPRPQQNRRKRPRGQGHRSAGPAQDTEKGE